MFFKQGLTEHSVYTSDLPKIIPINYDKININILENYYYNNCQNSSEFSYLNKYFFLEDDKNITWINDYIRDYFRLDYKKTLGLIHKAGIVQQSNESLNYHHHIDENNLKNSPDISAIVTTKIGKNPSYVEFQYKSDRVKNGEYRVPLKNKQVILFNSGLRHCFTKNNNSEALINLSLKFQLLD